MLKVLLLMENVLLFYCLVIDIFFQSVGDVDPAHPVRSVKNSLERQLTAMK